MAKSTFTGIVKILNLKTRKYFLLFSAVVLSTLVSFGQPVWTAGPAFTPKSVSIDVTFTLDQNSKVYYIAYPFAYAGGLSAVTVKALALSGIGAMCDRGTFIYSTPGVPATITVNNFPVNSVVTIFIVAESNPGGVEQAVAIKQNVTTLPCPKIDVLTGFTQPVVCVNKGTVATFQVVTLSGDPNATGILKGTQWTLDWGDGTTATYASTADNDLPPLALRTHTYVAITDCNYVFSNSIRNTCGETRAVQYVAVVHGRDIPSDGDGMLQIVDNATGSTTINVCAGTQTTITLRDNSTWNCQNPVLPGGLTAVPNTDPRNIEWLYGRDPVGAITNTITGNVAIAGLGNAPRASGRLSPIAAPGTLSQSITIPATCLAGQYFRVYLKNWNKCNWTDPEYVNTFVDINVIAAPPAPTAASKTICTGDVRTLTVTSPAVGTITWYSDALLTTVVGTGLTYVPVQTLPGAYDFWVTDQSTTGLLCMSPSTKVTLTIREALTQPGAITGPAQVCSNQVGVIYSVVANPPTMPVGGVTQYVWTVPAGWIITAGQGTRQITVTVNAVAGVQTISLVNQYTTVPNCPSALRSTTTNLNPVATINSANAKTVCNNTPLAYTATSATAGCTFAWTRAVVAGISNLAGAGATALINESLINSTTAPVNVIYIITPTINGCIGTPFNLTVTVNPTAVITSAAAKTVCNTTALAYTSTSSTVGATFAWTRAVVAGISNLAGAGGTALINELLTNTTTSPVNVIYIITPSIGGCAGTPFSLTVTVNPTAVITSAVTANICDNIALGYTASSSTAGATFAWTRAVVAGVSNLAGAGATALINESLDNTTTAPVAVTYIITPSYGVCAGTPFNLVVTVNPTSVITSAATKTICDNTPLAYTATSSTAGASFSWTRAVVAGISNGAGVGGTALINESLNNTTTAAINVIYIITPSINGCNGTPFNLTVTVNPTAVVTSAATKTVCNTTALAYTATSSTVGATFAWTRAVVAGISNVAGAGATSLINESLTNTTTAPVNATYIITPSYSGCTGAPFSLVVTVNPTAVITSAATANVCDNTPLGYTVTSSTAGASFGWTRAVVAGISNAAGAGATSSINESLDNTTTAPVAVTYIITPSYGGCGGTPFNLVVTVNPTAVVTSAAAKTVCSNVPLAYTSTSSTAGASFAWTRAVVAGISNGAGAGATSLINESLINTTAANVNAIYIITPSIGGCAGTPFNLTVTVHPQFTLAQLHDNVSICNNTAANINVAMTGGTTNYTVNYTKNGIAQAAWNNYVSGTNMTTGALLANTTYALTSVTDNYGCPAQSLGTSILITVGSTPTTATLIGNGDKCFGATSTINSTITGGAPTYIINYTRNGVAQPAINPYNSSTNYSLGVLPVGAYNIQITSVTDNCGNTVPPAGLPGVYTFTIYANPVAAAGPDQNICGPLVGTLAAVPSVGFGTWTKISGPGTVTFSNVNSATSNATVSAYGTYVLRWTEVTGGICSSFDEVTVAYAEAANAGPDQDKCGTLIATLAGNTPTVGSGAWTKISGPGTVTFSNAASPVPTATVSLYGSYVLRWTITNGSCNTFDEVTIDYAQAANAGPDQDICGALVATLAGNTPSVGSGAWTKISGPGTVTFSNAASPTSTATVSLYGSYVLRWTITNGSCNTVDNVTIDYAEAANAGPDQDKCGTLIATLAANAASVGVDSWTKISGPGTVTFSNASSPTSTATVSLYGTYVLRWTITNGSCNTTDDVTINYAEAAIAGPDQDKCGTLIATLAGNAASVGSGLWTKISGPGTVTFSNSASPVSTATVSLYGTYVLRWTITNGGCNTFDELTIDYAEAANAGPDQQICGALVANLAGNAASAGAGLWTKISGPGTVTFSGAANPLSTATVSLYGTYVLRWTITNGSCNTFDEVTIAYAEAANAGPDQQKCGTLITTLAGNAASAGSGLWTKISGPGTVTFGNSALPTSTATVSLYGTYVLRWTITNGSCNTFDEVTIAYAETANAGPDQQICGALVATLAGNAASAGAGLWTKISGPGTVTFSNSALATSTATVSLYGTYVLRWTITNGACNTFDEVTIAYAEAANAGPDQDKCGTLIATLAGNAASAGSGLWTKISGPGTVTFSNSALATSTATVSLYGTYVLRWTITNGSCNTFDEITINYAEAANAGPDQQKCGTLIATLAGNAPSVGSGLWTKISGPGTVTFSNSASPVSTATVSLYGTYVLRWTITNGGCNTFDEVTIAYAEAANAGPDQVLCSTLVATLAGNSASAGAGVWTKISGPGTVTFSNASSSVSTATVSLYGSYVLRWTITNGACNTFDEVSVSYEKAAVAGPQQDLCGLLVTTLAGNTPAVGTGTWTLVSGPGTVNFTPTVNTPAATATVSVYGAYVFKWTIDNGGICNTNQNVTINYNPAGQVDQPGSQVLCNGIATTAINFTTTNIIGTTTYAWTNSAPGIGLAASGSGNIASFTAVNNGTAPVVATIIVTPTLANAPASCVGSTKTFTITVNPTPALSTSLTPAAVCSNTAFSYAPASATAGTTFNWTRATVAGITPAGPTSGTNNPNETLKNITSLPIAVTYQYTLAANGCSNVQNVVVNINPEPVITPAQNPSACSGNALNYRILMNNFTNPADNVLFTWGVPVLNPVNPGFSGGTARAVASSANITDTFTNTMGAIGTATYTVTPFKNGCAGAPVTVVITVGSEPVLDPGLNAFACSNTPIGLLLKVSAGSVTPTYYNIISKNVSAGLTESGNASVPNATAPAAYLSADVYVNTTGSNKTVTYRVQPILAPDCIGAAVDVVITIRPQPVILLGQTKTVCSRVAIGKEILLSPVNVPAGSVFNWPLPAMSDGSVQGTTGVNVVADPAGTVHINDQIHNYSPAPIQAVYTVTPVSQFGCAGTPLPVVITVNPEPIPQVISGRDKICVNEKNIVYNVSAVGGSTFHWTVAPAIGTKTFDFNTNAILMDAAAVAGSGNVTVYETNSFGCSGDVSTLPVQVYSIPAAENIAGNVVVCANSTNVYSVTNRVGSTYSWTIPGGAAIVGDPSASSVTVVFANVGGTISVRETNAAGCVTNHNPKAITVNPLPTATISGGGTMCVGGTRNLSVNFTGTGPYTFTYAINGVSQAPVATAANPYTLTVGVAGTFTIVNVSDANCTNNGTGTATVSYFPQPSGIISGTTEVCSGSPATLTLTFTGTAPFTFTYTDGTTPVTVVNHLTNVFTVAVSPVVNTTYTLTALTDGNSCTGVISGSAVITVNRPPTLTLTGTNLTCYNVNTGAINMAIANGTAPFGFSWTGPNGFTANTQNITNLEAGYYAVVVNDTKGCTGTANITLTQPPVLAGSAAGTNITCFGAGDGTITVTGISGGAGTYQFTINGGGAWQASPSFTGLAPGSYNVMMRDAANPACILVLNNALQLTQPAVLNATVVKTDINCFGATNGSIVISAPTGGYGTYGYSINGGTSWQGSGNFTNLATGSYDVRIRDAVNTSCTVTLNPAITISQPVQLSATVAKTDVTCFGSTDGSITISAPAGGHGTYEYSINGGGSWQGTGTYSALAPGTYNVQIRDAGFTGCFRVLNAALVISQPAVLQATVASTNVTCNGANDGSVSITAPLGGYGTYQYSINGGGAWQASGTFNGLLPATYDVRIRDAANPLCFIILNPGLQITEPAMLSATVVKTDVTCFGANDGQIQVTNSAGGYGTYDYSINGGGVWQATGLFTGLAPATYNVQIRDRAHTACVKVLDAALVVTQPAVLNASVAHTNVTCFGAGDGTITISSPSGGYGSYGYSINGGTSWQGSGNFTGLAPGTYNIRIRDAVNTGCIIALNPAVVITQPVILSATVAKTNVNCNGASDGTITINGAAGGSGAYEYTVNGGATWQASNLFSGLLPGFYNVKIRDAANITCIITLNASLNVTEPAVLNASVAKTNITCNGSANGTISITGATGGYGTYEYSINGGTSWQGSGLFIGLAPNTYNVQIRDAAHITCVITLNAALVITEPAILTATVTPTMVSCFGANNGIIAITGASGGYGTYEYTINGGTTWSGLGTFTNLAPATYNVRIRDAANTSCVIILNGALAITQPPVLAATVTRTNITCFGASNGTITVSAPSGGYGTYEYSINGGGSWQGSGNFTALGPGNYNVQIRDAAHTSCVIVLNNAVQITQPAVLNAVVTPTNVSCNGANNGIISITAPAGGYGTYEYSIDGGTNWQASGLFNGLAPSTYDVRIRDGANIACVIILNNSLTITEPAVITANIASTNVTCNGANDGTIIVSSPAGGYGTYEYSRDGGATWQATGNFTALAPASYNVQIRDKAHTACVVILNPALVITQPAILSATVASSNVTCFGSNDGTITITNPLGGYGTYGYSVNGGASWQSSGNFTNLAPGAYNVRIRDAANIACVIILNPALSITEPAVLTATVASTNVTCAGAGDGTITISAAAGGYGTYEYSVNGGSAWQASGNFTGLIPGFYNVQMRDGLHTSCVKILNGSLQITQPAPLSASVAKTNVTCNGASDGTITLSSPSGGYGTYEYSINGGTGWQASGSFTGLAPSSYNVQIRDAAHTGCIIILNPALVITQPAVLTATATPTMVTCNAANDGIITVSGAAGGYGTYQYSVNGGTTWQGTGTFTNLAPANYDVRIRDAANTGCVAIINPALAITQPAVLSATLSRTNVTCFSGSDGTITISAPAGGYGTYEYSINGGGAWQASGNFTLLGPGSYNIQIRDALHTGCVRVLNASYAITQPAALNAVVTPSNVTCNGANDGIINITAPTGGSGTYGYSIDGGTTWQAGGLFNALVPATYNVQIRDAANITCLIILNSSVTITEPPVMSAVLTSSNISCNGVNDGSISITGATGGYGTYDYTIDGGTNWLATGNFVNLIPGTYNVQIRDKAHPACVIILNPALVITQPAALSATVASTNITCFGANNGTITITNPLGGYGTYSYSINGGSTWQPSGNFTNLVPSTYIVKIRDAAHIACETTLNAGLVITQPAILSGTVTRTNVTCNGSSDGTISISAPAGGSGTYQYSINGGAAWQASGNFTGLLPGFYNVEIRDAVNTSCVIILNGSLQITQPAVLSAFVSKTNVSCNGSADGSITILGATGGYGTYEYSINGVTWVSSGAFTNLAPATYSVQIRDAANQSCVKILDPALVVSQPAVLSATVTPAMVTCFGANDGRITITNPLGGYGSYQFSVNGGTSWQGSGTFTNLAPASYNVMIRDAGNIGCVITLNPALVITQPPVLSATLAHTNVTCFGGNDGTITISAPAGGYGTYEYSINGGGSWQASGNFTLLSPGSYTVLIRDAVHTGCVVILNNAYIIGQPALLAATVAKTDITCQGANDGTITISSPTGGNGTYEYTINGGTTWSGSGSFVNQAPGTYDIRIRDAANPLCSVILYPNLVISEPILLAVTSTGNITLSCFGNTDGTGTFFGSGGTMPYTFHVITNTTGGTMAAPGFNSQTFFNAGAGTITVAITDLRGCFAQTTITITQPALLTPGTIGANQVLCAGSNPAQLTETVPAAGGPAAYNYQWQYGTAAGGPFINVAGATSAAYTPAAGANSTLYYRRMVTSGLCMPVYSNVVEVLVNPRPVAILTGGETICPAQSSILKVNMMVGTGPFELDIDNIGTITGYVSGSDITVTPAATTTYRLLRVRDANGCEVISPSANLMGSATVTVRTAPAITTSPVDKTICEYAMVTFDVAATGSDLTYQWYVNTGSGFSQVSDGGIYFGATNSTLSIFGASRLMNGYIYHAVVTGCSTTVTSADATLNVNTAPEIIKQPRDTTACMNAGAAFIVNVTGTSVGYQWQVNKGAGFVNVVADANFSGVNLNTLTITNAQAAFNNYIFRVVMTGVCGIPTYSNFAILRVNIPPVVTVNPANKAVCDGMGPVVFSANGSGVIDSLRWEVFSGGVWSDVHDNAIYSGSTSQQLTISSVPISLNGNLYRLALKAKCETVNTNGATLTVNANPVVNFSAVDPIHACGGVPIIINGNPTGGSGTWSTHSWTGDVGPLNNYFIQSPTFNSLIAGSYALNYRVKDNKGCFGSGDVTVLVDSPDATFTMDRSNGCTPVTVNFTKDMTGIAKFWWDFGDGSPKDSVNANPVHLFTNASPASINYFTVKLTVRSAGGCLASFNSTVTVYPAIDATFTATPSTVCSGKQITFTTLPGASKYFWDFGDGISGYFTNSTNHLYTNNTQVPVIHTVTLTTTSFYNCTDVKTFNITVMPVPLPQFAAAPVTQIYNAAGNSVVFTNLTNPGTWTWLWRLGDGATSNLENPSHTYIGLGTYDVTLKVSNASCSDSVKHSVSVTPIPPVAQFDLIPSGCSPLTINPNNTSLYTDTPGTTYLWDFGDGGVSTSKNPSYLYTTPGTYRVELIVRGPGGTSNYSQVVNSYQSPKAYFEVTPQVVFVNDEKVRFFNLTEGADSYLWEFGDGDTSKIKEPYHRYMEEGSYDVTLWAYLHNIINGETVVCSDKYILSPGVTVEPAGVLRFSTVFTPNKDGEINMDHLPTGGTEIDQFFYPPIREKVIDYKLQIFNRLGVLIFESHDINIPWNGYYQHKLCQQGVYVWYVEGKFANGTPFKKVGDITLLH
jgi:hypothetical protein